MKKLKIKRLVQNDLHKQIRVCFGSVVDAARVLDYPHSIYLYAVINDETKRLDQKKVRAGPSPGPQMLPGKYF